MSDSSIPYTADASKSFLTKLIAGVHTPKVGVTFGDATTSTDVTASTPLPVTNPTSLPLPTGAATSAKQDELLTELQLKADLSETQPVSLTSVPLPTGAATSALQTTGNTSLSNIDGKLPSIGTHVIAASVAVNIASDQTVPVSAASLPLPTGAATSALQTTGNTSLSNIDTKTPALVSGRQPVDGSGVTQPVSAASLPLPTGAATSALQTTGNTSLSNIDGKLPSIGTHVIAASVAVNIASDQTVPVTVTSSNLPYGAATEAKQPALGTAGTASADVITIQGKVGMTSVNIQGAAGMTAVVVDGSNVTQPVSVISLPLPTGAATSALQTTGNTNLSSIDSSVSSINTKTPALVSGRQPVDGSGVTQPVSAASLPLPTGAATSALQTTGNTSLSSIDTKTPALVSGRQPVDGSGVTQPVSAASLPLPTGAATSALQTTGNTSLSSIDGKLPSIGAHVIAASVAVNVASDQVVPVQINSLLYPSSTGNNTSAQLAAGATFTGAVETILSLQASQVEVICDQPYTLIIEQFIDAAGTLKSSKDVDYTFTRTAGIPTNENITLPGNYFRIKLTNNGGVATTTLRVDVTFGMMATAPYTVSNLGNAKNAINELAGTAIDVNSGNKSAGTMRVVLATDQPVMTNAQPVTVGVAATSLGKAEDAPATSGDTGVMILGVRRDALTISSSAAGDYNEIATDKFGAILTKDFRNLAKTYRCAMNISALAASPTDIAELFGNGTTTVVITAVELSGIQTTGGNIQVILAKRSTANTAGTKTSGTAVPLDATDAAASSIPAAYTANPTLGTLVGNIDRKFNFVPGAASVVTDANVRFAFGDKGKGCHLSGTSQGLCVNLNGVTLVGGNVNIVFEWFEF